MYIGEKEVSSIDGAIVKFIDNTTQVFTEENLKYLVTEEPQDATALQELYVENVSKEIIDFIRAKNVFDSSDENIQSIQVGVLDILEKNDVRTGDLKDPSDLDAIIQKVTLSYFKTLNEAFKRVAYTMEDTMKDALTTVCGTKTTSDNPGQQLRNIRISDLKKLRNIN